MKSKQCLKAAGFTLIEVLIVLFIISIVTSVALLSIGHNENKQIKLFANELTQTLTLAQEQAMLQPTVLGLAIDNNSFQFSTYTQANKEQQSNWIPIEDKLLGKHQIPQGVQLNVSMTGNSKKQADDEINKDQPQIVISTNGDVTPFAIYIGKPGKKPQYVIRGNADGKITNTWLG